MLVAAVVQMYARDLVQMRLGIGTTWMNCLKQIIFSYKAAVDYFTLVTLTAANFIMFNLQVVNIAASFHLRWTRDSTTTPATEFHLSLKRSDVTAKCEHMVQQQVQPSQTSASDV